MKVVPEHISFRYNKNRWGSCSSTNRILFNYHLVKLSSSLIEYVVIHELANITFENHSKDFWKMVHNYLPEVMVIFGVLDLNPWYEPRFLIPIAGMIFANSMNAVSISAERFENEIEIGYSYMEARATSYRAALIPIINSLFAVGLVSLPGMMTWQILSGVDPLIAVRYQIMVMLMILGSAGISVAVYLLLLKKG